MAAPPVGPPGLPPPFGSGSPLPFPDPTTWQIFGAWNRLNDALCYAHWKSLYNTNRIAGSIIRGL